MHWLLLFYNQMIKYLNIDSFVFRICYFISSSVFDLLQIISQEKMKEEELQPRTKTTETGKKKEEKPIEEPKLERVNPDAPVNPMVNPSKIREENQLVFNAAQGERKAMNFERIKEYMQKRTESFQERVRICDTIRAMFFEKQKNTKAFLKNVIRYFEDYVELYTSLSKSLGKLDLKRRYEHTTMYTAVKDSIAEMIKLNDEESQHVQNFVDWLDKILVEALKSSYKFFNQRVKKLNKDLETSDYNYFNSWSKEEKVYEKLPESKDLLEKEILLMQHIKTTNEAAITRAVELYQAWGYLLEEQNTIKRLLKDNILQFHDRFVKFHKKTDSANAILKYWSSLPASANPITVFSSFLDQKAVNYIMFGSKSIKLADNFENFMKMVDEEKRIGNPAPYLDILVIKKFKSKLQLTQRDWKDIKLIFSVDGNLLIVDEKQDRVVLKLMENSLKLKRMSENILELNGLEEGVIFNSKKKESIHFETLDEVEEFVYYVNSIPEQKKEEEK